MIYIEIELLSKGIVQCTDISLFSEAVNRAVIESGSCSHILKSQIDRHDTVSVILSPTMVRTTTALLNENTINYVYFYMG